MTLVVFKFFNNFRAFGDSSDIKNYLPAIAPAHNRLAIVNVSIVQQPQVCTSWPFESIVVTAQIRTLMRLGSKSSCLGDPDFRYLNIVSLDSECRIHTGTLGFLSANYGSGRLGPRQSMSSRNRKITAQHFHFEVFRISAAPGQEPPGLEIVPSYCQVSAVASSL